MELDISIHWISLIWTICSFIGLILALMNFQLARQDLAAVRRVNSRPSLIVAAFTPVRSHLLIALMHSIFFIAGVGSIFNHTPQQIPITLVGWLYTIILLSIPFLLIIKSQTIHMDRIKATKLARNGS